MTPEERARLEHVERTLNGVEEKLAALYDAFLEPGPDGSPPLRDRVARIVIAAERSEWALRSLSRGMAWVGAAIGALLGWGAAVKAGAVESLFGWFK